MKLTLKQLEIILKTSKDRTESKIDRLIHKPFKNRSLVPSPIDLVLKLTNQSNLDKSEVLAESYLDSIQRSMVLEQIDYELKKNLPNLRYEAVKNFKNFKD